MKARRGCKSDSPDLSEHEARRLLCDCPGPGSGPGLVEDWIAEQPWQAAPGGRTLSNAGWTFRLDVVHGALRITASSPGLAGLESWMVTAR